MRVYDGIMRGLKEVLEHVQGTRALRVKIIDDSGVTETAPLLSNPDPAQKLIDGKNTPLSQCVPESEVKW